MTVNYTGGSRANHRRQSRKTCVCLAHDVVERCPTFVASLERWLTETESLCTHSQLDATGAPAYTTAAANHAASAHLTNLRNRQLASASMRKSSDASHALQTRPAFEFAHVRKGEAESGRRSADETSGATSSRSRENDQHARPLSSLLWTSKSGAQTSSALRRSDCKLTWMRGGAQARLPVPWKSNVARCSPRGIGPASERMRNGSRLDLLHSS